MENIDSHDAVMSIGHEFGVEHNGDSFVSYFPYALSHLQSTHTTELDAWEHILSSVTVQVMAKYNWKIQRIPSNVVEQLFNGTDNKFSISAHHQVFDDIQYSTMQFTGTIEMAVSHAMRLFGHVSMVEDLPDCIKLLVGSYVVTIMKI